MHNHLKDVIMKIRSGTSTTVHVSTPQVVWDRCSGTDADIIYHIKLLSQPQFLKSLKSVFASDLFLRKRLFHIAFYKQYAIPIFAITLNVGTRTLYKTGYLHFSTLMWE